MSKRSEHISLILAQLEDPLRGSFFQSLSWPLTQQDRKHPWRIWSKDDLTPEPLSTATPKLGALTTDLQKSQCSPASFPYCHGREMEKRGKMHLSHTAGKKQETSWPNGRWGRDQQENSTESSPCGHMDVVQRQVLKGKQRGEIKQKVIKSKQIIS